MLVRQGESRTGTVDRRLGSILAGIAGAVNVAAFKAVGFFAANMTGNVSSASTLGASGDFASAGLYLLIVATFVVGATASTVVIGIGRRRRMRGVYALTILIEAVAMASLSLLDPLLQPGWRGPVLVVGLSFLMGLQNAVVTTISNTRVRTTHVSGMVTDIGIGIGTLMTDRGRRPAAWSTLGLHGVTVLSFFAGGVGGALVYQAAGANLLLVCAAVLFVFALRELGKARAWERSSAA